MKTVMTFTKEDIELLKKPIPTLPCTTCRNTRACCGCPERREYNEKVKPYKEANIIDIARELLDITDMEKKIEKMQKQVADMKANLPEEVKKAIFQEN